MLCCHWRQSCFGLTYWHLLTNSGRTLNHLFCITFIKNSTIWWKELRIKQGKYISCRLAPVHFHKNTFTMMKTKHKHNRVTQHCSMYRFQNPSEGNIKMCNEEGRCCRGMKSVNMVQLKNQCWGNNSGCDWIAIMQENMDSYYA